MLCTCNKKNCVFASVSQVEKCQHVWQTKLLRIWGMGIGLWNLWKSPYSWSNTYSNRISTFRFSFNVHKYSFHGIFIRFATGRNHCETNRFRMWMQQRWTHATISTTICTTLAEYPIISCWNEVSWWLNCKKSFNIQLFQLKTFHFPGNFNLLAILTAACIMVIVIIVLIIVLNINRHSAKYYTNEDKRCGKTDHTHYHCQLFVVNLICIHSFWFYRWTVWEKYWYAEHYRKWVELQISHRWYHLYNRRDNIAATVPATVNIFIHHTERVN